MTAISVVIGNLGTVKKGLVNGLEDLKIWGRVYTIQTTALLRSARILRRVKETLGDLLSLNGKPSAKAGVKSHKGVK